MTKLAYELEGHVEEAIVHMTKAEQLELIEELMELLAGSREALVDEMNMGDAR